jgi:GNAT superfamily N-acetyltransferase
MSLTIRWASPADAEDLALLLCEMAVHYRPAPLARDAAQAAAWRWLMDESPAYPHFALAWRDDTIAGLASVAIAHPGVDLKRLMFLKDLFVRDGHRNAGCGKALLKFLAGECISRDIGRIDLTAEDWNEDAIRFYEHLGVERHGQKIFLRLDGDRLKQIAGRGPKAS